MATMLHRIGTSDSLFIGAPLYLNSEDRAEIGEIMRMYEASRRFGLVADSRIQKVFASSFMEKHVTRGKTLADQNHATRVQSSYCLRVDNSSV